MTIANASTVAEAKIDETLDLHRWLTCDTVPVVAAFHSADHSRSRKHTAGDVRLELAAVGDGGRLQPIAARARHGAGPAPSSLGTRQFKTLEEYRSHASDQHSVLVDYDVFMNVPRLDAQDVATVQNVYKAESFDFRRQPGSAAVDRGRTLPNVTDGFAGPAPDLGAIELGEAAPHYGPRD